MWLFYSNWDDKLSLNNILHYLIDYWRVLQHFGWGVRRNQNFGWGGQFFPWSSHVSGRKFSLNFRAFLCISQAKLGRSLWSGYHWKDLFLLQKLSIDDANCSQKWWSQNWKKGEGSSRPVTAGKEVNGLYTCIYIYILWKAKTMNIKLKQFLTEEKLLPPWDHLVYEVQIVNRTIK